MIERIEKELHKRVDAIKSLNISLHTAIDDLQHYAIANNVKATDLAHMLGIELRTLSEEELAYMRTFPSDVIAQLQSQGADTSNLIQLEKQWC